MPVPGAAAAWHSVAVHETCRGSAWVVPKYTAVAGAPSAAPAAWKPLPVITVSAPPRAGPTFGLTPLTVGASALKAIVT